MNALLPKLRWSGILTVLAVLVWMCPGPPAKAAFSSLVEDLPIMPGLTEAAEEGLSFDKPDGRIVEIVARGDVMPGDVVSFYRDTLPALGWDRTMPPPPGSLVAFRRGGEVLLIGVARAQSDKTTVRFSIAPVESND